MVKFPHARVTGAVNPEQTFADLQRRTTRTLLAPALPKSPTLVVTTPDGQLQEALVPEDPPEAMTPQGILTSRERPVLTPLDTHATAKVLGPRSMTSRSTVGELTPPETPRSDTQAELLSPLRPWIPAPRRSGVLWRQELQPASAKPKAPVPAASQTPPVAAPVLPQRWYMGPGGTLLLEHAVPAKFVGCQVACDQFPHMRLSDWRELSTRIDELPLDIAPENWAAFVTLIASLPVAEQAQAVKSVRAVVDERACRHMETAPEALLVAMRQVPSKDLQEFGLVATVGGAFTSQKPTELARTLATLAQGFAPVASLLSAPWLPPEWKRGLRECACLAAERVSRARQETQVEASASSACLPLDANGIGRILSVAMREMARPSGPRDTHGALLEKVDSLLKLARKSGPLPLELMPNNKRYDGELVADTIFAELASRGPKGAAPPVAIAHRLYEEAMTRVRKQLLDGSSTTPAQFAAFHLFEARLHLLFDHFGWARPKAA